MKNNKKFMAVVASVAITSQLLPIGSVITYAQTNNIKNTLVEREASTLAQNEITLVGCGCQAHGDHRFTIGFDTTDTNHMKIKIKDIVGGDHTFHPYFSGEYIKLRLIGENGKEKKSVTMNGTQNVLGTIKKEFDNLEFEYGDYLEIHHAEANGRVKIKGTVKSETHKDFSQGVSKDELDYGRFKLTKSGLEYVSNKTRNEIIIDGCGCNLGTHSFKISFDKANEKLIVKSIAGKTHEIEPYYKDKPYVTVQVVDPNGNEVKKVTLKGNDPVLKAEELNGCEFKNDYGLRITHAKGGSYVRVYGYVDYCAFNLTRGIDKDLLQKITFREGKNGLYYQESRIYHDEILLKGMGCSEGMHQFKLQFNTRDRVILVRDTIGRYEFHPYFGDQKYIELTLTSKDGIEKKSVTLRGNDHFSKIVEAFDNLHFEYGDRLTIYHAEGNQRFQVIDAFGVVKNQTKGTHTYEIGEDRLIPVNN